MHVFYEYIQDFLAPGIWTTNIQYGVLTLVSHTVDFSFVTKKEKVEKNFCQTRNVSTVFRKAKQSFCTTKFEGQYISEMVLF